MTGDVSDRDTMSAGGIGFFEKWLSARVGFCVVAWLWLGNATPAAFTAIVGLEYASANLVVAGDPAGGRCGHPVAVGCRGWFAVD